MAAKYKQDQITTFLLNEKLVNTGHVDSTGNTALIWACLNEMAGLALRLVDGCDPNHANDDGETALFWACRQRMGKVALALTAMGGRNLANDFGETPLMWACRRRLYEVARALIAFGLNRSFHGDTALMLACDDSTGTSTALALISAKCNLNCVNKTGESALVNAARNELDYVVSSLIGRGCDLNDLALYLACQGCTGRIALELIAAGCDPNCVGIDGETVLMLACQFRLTDVALALIAANCDLNPADHYESNTALLMACIFELDEIALGLIAAGCDPNRTNKKPKTALLLACENWMTDVALALIAANCDLNPTDKRGTPL